MKQRRRVWSRQYRAGGFHFLQRTSYVLLLNSFLFSLILFSILLLLPLPAQAEEGSKGSVKFIDNILAPWNISGANTLHTEYYDVTGDASASPYSKEGVQWYNELSLNVNKLKSPFDTWRWQISGLLNDSDYRSADDGFILERFNLFHENGDAKLPYRIEAGDIYSYFSYRTLQTSLKGVQVELQPRFNFGSHSIFIVSGANQSSWRHFQPDDDYTQGISYLFNGREIGRYSLNFVNNYRRSDPAANTLHRVQNVYSIAGEKGIDVGAQSLTIESEVSAFSGDHDGSSGAESGQGRHETGLFAQVSGKSNLPLIYRLRYEEYGQDYRPVGAAVSSGRRSSEYHAGWRFAEGLQLRGRIQNFRDSLETANPTDTRTYGVSLSGPMLTGIVNNLSESLDLFVQYAGNSDRTTDSIIESVNLNLSKPISAGWNGRLGIFYQRSDNRTEGSTDTKTEQVSFGVDGPIKISDFKGVVTPGVVMRRSGSSTNKSVDYIPTLALNMQKGAHNISYNMAYNNQDRRKVSSTDVVTLTHNIKYRYTKKRNTIGVELASEGRNPDPGETTDSFKVAVFWTYSFEKPARRREETVAKGVLPETPPMMAEVDLAELTPGITIEMVRERLAQANITGAVEQPNLLIYEARLLDEIDQRQRLALVHEAGRLNKAALIVEFENIGMPDDLMQTFELIRKILIDRYGKPAGFYEKGDITDDLIDNIRGGTFIRITEWAVPEGIIRFGIPRRLDRQIRMEIQFSEDFPPVTDTLWSVEGVR